MNAQGTRQAQNILRNMRIHTHNFVCSQFHNRRIDRTDGLRVCISLQKTDIRPRRSELGLTWHAFFIGTPIEIYLAPGWSGQGV